MSVPEQIERIYTYTRNGKEITVRRRWNKSNKISPKHEAVKEYFDNDMDNIRAARNIRAVYNDFVEKNPENRCSYSTLYAYYQSVFNMRKIRRAQEATSESENEVDVQVCQDRGIILFLIEKKYRLPPAASRALKFGWPVKVDVESE